MSLCAYISVWLISANCQGNSKCQIKVQHTQQEENYGLPNYLCKPMSISNSLHEFFVGKPKEFYRRLPAELKIHID